MEAKWSPLYDSAQFKCDMLAQYLQKFDWEDDDEDDDKTQYEYYNEDEDEDEDEGEQDRELHLYPYTLGFLKEFLRQVRTTRGYNVDAVGTWFMRSPFRTVIPAFQHNYDWVLSKAIEVAINHINSKTGKVYKHVRTLRIVDSPHSLLLLTFTAKTSDSDVQTSDSGEQTSDSGEHAGEQTFLATVYSPRYKAPIEEFKLHECFLKPGGPAPWEYVDLKSYVDLKGKSCVDLKVS